MSDFPLRPLRVGQIVRTIENIQLFSIHITVLSQSAPANGILPQGTEAEIIDVQPAHVDLDCKIGQSYEGPAAWGFKVRVAKSVWGTTFGLSR